MTITIDLPPELEGKLREHARVAGISAERIVVDALADRLAQDPLGVTNEHRLDATESELLQAINRGPPEAEWNRYHELVRLRRAGTLTADQHGELIRLSDAIEVIHAARIENVVRLAKLRNVPVARLMDELGLRTPSYD